LPTKRKTPLHSKKPDTKKPIAPQQDAPPVSPAESAGQIREILDRLFDGNAEEIVKTLADSGELTSQEMARMKDVFGKHAARHKKRGTHGSKGQNRTDQLT
jgi:hypothetical protein